MIYYKTFANSIFYLKNHQKLRYLECGIPKIKPKSNEISDKIIGGQVANPNSWPWQVLLSDNTTKCGGTLISKEWYY